MKTFPFYTCISLAALLFFAASCTPTQETPILTVNPQTFSLGATVNQTSFRVTSTESWEIVENTTDWCTFTPDKFIAGTTVVKIQVTQLPSSASRSALFTIRSLTSGVTKDIMVQQSNTFADNQFIDFYNTADYKPPFIERSHDVARKTIYINTNVASWIPMVAAGGDWVTLEKDDDTLFVSVADVASIKGRSTTVTVAAGGSLGASFDISQLGLLETNAHIDDFTLSIPDSTDTGLSLSSVFRDNLYTIIYFWGSWCPDCSGFLASMKKLYETYSPNLGIYGIALEIVGHEQTYFDYLKSSGLEDVGADGKKLWWENRPLFNTYEYVKKNDFTRRFYGDDPNFIPALIIVNGDGIVRKTFLGKNNGAESYTTSTESGALSLYRQVDDYLSTLYDCNCGGGSE